MPRKNISQRRTDKLAKMNAIKEEVAKLEVLTGEHIGKLAIKAGLVDLNLSDNTLMKEFQAIVRRFLDEQKKSPEPPPSSASSQSPEPSASSPETA